jgi:F0F1-type ATP synthase alpha subunit
MLDQVPVALFGEFKRNFFQYMRSTHPEVGRTISETKTLDDQTINALRQATEEFIATSNYREQA